MLQNFYDGNGHTLEGVDIDIKYKNGKYIVKISGKGIYDYKQVYKLGENNHNSGDAGKFGEGMKVMFATLLNSRGSTYVRHSSGDWIVDLTAELGKSKSRSEIMGNLQRADKRLEGSSVEFDTTDENLVQELLKAKDYFYTPYNEDFQDMNYENEFFGIKFLPKGEKGNIYVVQRFEVEGEKGLDNTIDGMTLVFKVMPDDTSIKDNPNNKNQKFKLETGRNRTPLTKDEIKGLVNRYAMTIPDEELISIIGNMRDVYIYNPKERNQALYILEGLTIAALARKLKIDFGHDNYVAVNTYTPSEQIKFAQMMGKTILTHPMQFVGIPSIGEYYSESKKNVLPEANPTEVQANKLKIVDEAIKLFAKKLDLKNRDVVTLVEAMNPRYLFDKPNRDRNTSEAAEAITADGKSLGMWIDKPYFDSISFDLFEYMATWLHEISHKEGGDGSKPFNERIQKLVMLVTQMCETDPAFRTKLRVLNEEFKRLNGYTSERKEINEDFNPDDFISQMERDLRHLVEDSELPMTDEEVVRNTNKNRGIVELPDDYEPTALDYVANQVDKFGRKIKNYKNSIERKLFERMSASVKQMSAAITNEKMAANSPKYVPDIQPPRKTSEDQNVGVFEYNPPQEKVSNKTTFTDPLRYTRELTVLQLNGSLTINLPPLTDREAKKDFSGISDTDRARFEAEESVETNMTLRYNSSNAWSLPQVARDMLQNLCDGHRGTLDGVNFDFKYENGKYKVRISGKSEFDYFFIEKTGASGEEGLNDGSKGGGFGEGAKMVPLHLLYGKYVDKYTYASGDWSIDFTRQKDSNGNELPVDKGYLMRTPHINKEHIDGNYIEFESENPQLVQAILAARNYFYHSENPDFKDFDVETPDFGFTILPENERGNLYYGQRYSIKSEKTDSSKDFDNVLSGIKIVFKRTLTPEELKLTEMTKDCDRLGLSKTNICEIAYTYAKNMSDKQLMDAISQLQRYWTYTIAPHEYHELNFEQNFAKGLIQAAALRGLRFNNTDDIKILCIDSRNYDSGKANELIRRGYLIAETELHPLGFKSINEVFDDITRIEPHKASSLTIQEQAKIRLLEEAFNVNISDEQNGFQAKIVTFDSSVYQNNVELYTRDVDGFKLKLPYLAIDRTFLRQNDFQTCYNAIISGLRLLQADTKADYGYKLTDLISSQLRALSSPQNAQRLKLIEERYKQIQ